MECGWRRSDSRTSDEREEQQIPRTTYMMMRAGGIDIAGRMRMREAGGLDLGWIEWDAGRNIDFPESVFPSSFSFSSSPLPLSPAIIDSAIGVTNRNCTHCIVRRGPS